MILAHGNRDWRLFGGWVFLLSPSAAVTVEHHYLGSHCELIGKWVWCNSHLDSDFWVFRAIREMPREGGGLESLIC